MSDRFIGIDVGAETLKVVELVRRDGALIRQRTRLLEHGKKPGPAAVELLRDWDWHSVCGAAVTGRLARLLNLPHIPPHQALAHGFRLLHPNQPATIVSIGVHGFSVLELRPNGTEVYRENSRCSQGTGNFLRQLVGRFSLSVEEAGEMCADVADPSALSSRCPVILKTDMTHLANKGVDRIRILAGLFDAVCDNVLVLLKPGISPPLVALTGGVSRSRRIRKTFGRFLAENGMAFLPLADEDARLLEAIGSAAIASGNATAPPPIEKLILAPEPARLELLPPLHNYRDKIHRMAASSSRLSPLPTRHLILGFDIGSTGSKLIAWDPASSQVYWEGYRRTGGDPVGAAQDLGRRFLQQQERPAPILAVGVTGSGREIVGSLMATCFGNDSVFVLNEIAAHAAGALHFDSRVDTIFEIGGQDAKYIRLAEGRVVDCAMNEACSAGTGSFIEEQGQRFAGFDDVSQFGHAAMQAARGVSLGQHCSVFMAEIIDEAAAAGIEEPAIIAGLYDSIIQNYLNRVKGNRSVGQVIFCQGMPFCSEALAAAVSRQTGSEVIVPPNPGTIGALGIALLASRELSWKDLPPLELTRFLEARIEGKETFACESTAGCGGAGNRCRIDLIRTRVGSERKRFAWGGGCSLHDKGTRKKKLPDRAPDPFREREALLRQVLADRIAPRGFPKVALADEFMLKGLFAFFAAFVHELGFDLDWAQGADQGTLRRGIQEANVPFCAPMQLFHGLANRMAESGAQFLLLPMVRHIQRQAGEPHSTSCPIVQGSPDIISWDLRGRATAKILSPLVDVGNAGLDSAEFHGSCRALARLLGCSDAAWQRAHPTAAAVQARFETECMEIGRRTLEYCEARGITPVVVLGRPYTIYNTVLNSNVPALLREQGTIAIPLDCYPVDDSAPVFDRMYWGHGQRILRAAHQIRRTPDVYSIYCSNYSCGPDSFNLHFYSYIMDGKPYAVIETDGHSGDAGTKTRVEAYLYCVAEDRRRVTADKPASDFRSVQCRSLGLPEIRRRADKVLIPWTGLPSEVIAACLNAIGMPAESLPKPDAEALRLGRRHTSGKECLPMCITLGNLLKHLQNNGHNGNRYALLMPGTNGPCRFGVYNLLNWIVLDRLKYNQVQLWSPRSGEYFDGIPGSLKALLFSGFMVADLLNACLLDARATETSAGAAQRIYERYGTELLRLLRDTAGNGLSTSRMLGEVIGGRLFGMPDLLSRAASEFGAIKGRNPRPTVLVAGEIYVRCDPFANDNVIAKLEARGLRTRLAPFYEWLEYCDFAGCHLLGPVPLSKRFSSRLQQRIQGVAYRTVAEILGWPSMHPVRTALSAVRPYLQPQLLGEAVLTLGHSVSDWRTGAIDGVVSVGPLECMPNKIAEAQFFHMGEREGLPNLTLSYNGDAIGTQSLDSFAFQVHRLFRQRHGNAVGGRSRSV